MDLEPVNDLEPGPDGGWIATGVDPHFHIRLVGGRPAGWWRLRCRLVGDFAAEPRPCLYVDYGFGFAEEERVELAWRAGSIDEPVYLPAGTQVVRFDPCDGPGRMTIEAFAFAPAPTDAGGSRPPPSWLPAHRDRRFRALAVHDLRRVPGRPDVWDATGSDPQFRLDARSTRSLRSRWLRIEARLEADPGTRLRPSLYVRRAGAAADGDQHYLRVVGGRIDDVVLVPPDAAWLRLDPSEEPGRFAFSHLAIRPVGPVRAWARICAKFWATLQPEARRPLPLVRAAFRHLRLFAPAEIPGLIRRRVDRPPMDAAYAAWIDAVERPSRESAHAMATTIAGFRTRPVFSIVVPVYETPKEWLVAAIESVRAQAYPHWQLCLCDDASPSPHVGGTLARYAAEDPRVTVVTRRKNGHIARATNDALAAATGTHMVLMDHDDVIPPHALYEFARAIEAEPQVDLIYSDEDKITLGGQRYAPFFKPDWSPDTLEGCMYTAHLACYAMGLVREVGGFRPECDGAQDYDFVLRFTERARIVRHVPKILYHWRAIPGSTAADLANKDYATRATLLALAARADRTGRVDVVRPGPVAGSFALRRAIVGRPLVSVVVHAAGIGPDALRTCLASLGGGGHGPVDVVVDADGAAGRGIRDARGDLLLLLDGDLVALTPDWLESLVAAVQVPGVGIVGAKLLAADGTLLNAGLTIHDGLPDPIRRGYPGDDPGYAYSSVARRDCLALSAGCLMMARDVFEAAGGFDPALGPDLAAADLCLRLRARGLRAVFEPAARFRLLGSRDRARGADDAAEAALFRTRWSGVVRRDPYYPEWLRTGPATYELDPVRFPPG